MLLDVVTDFDDSFIIVYVFSVLVSRSGPI